MSTADEPERRTVILPKSLWGRIDNFRFDQRIETKTKAVERLIEIAFATFAGGAAEVPQPEKEA